METYRIEARVFGLGWICCGYCYDRGEAERREAVIRDESPRLYPGEVPRETRIRTQAGRIRRRGEKWERLGT